MVIKMYSFIIALDYSYQHIRPYARTWDSKNDEHETSNMGFQNYCMYRKITEYYSNVT